MNWDNLENERTKLRRQRTILLTNEIFDCEAECVIQDLELLAVDSNEPVTLIIASPGGNAFAGYAIMRAIQRAQSRGVRIIGQVHGHAMSMAFFVLQCCDERVMGKFCNLMCHGVTTFTVGDMKNIEAETKIMRKFQHEMSVMLAERCTAMGSEYKEAGFWHAVLEDNTPQFYDSEESIVMGIIDRVEE